ncbi:WD repeat-containing protein 27 [Galemys pyrenaicus]|uniref:WD repeat-containing protein 27 n=1 Tax=Galemys pyrenaicus TaxID=202257 RepID=A0A8J5ZP25_GALPY|nr:WD repeat-containing protein 27 [Galemys pyrenaicus]
MRRTAAPRVGPVPARRLGALADTGETRTRKAARPPAPCSAELRGHQPCSGAPLRRVAMERATATAGAEDRALQRWAVASAVPAPHVQLACGAGLCAFPLHGSLLCVRSTGGPARQPLILRGHRQPITATAFGNAAAPLLLCSASRDRVLTWDLDGCREQALRGLAPQGTVRGSLLGHVRFLSCSPEDGTLAVCTGARVLVLDLQGQSAPLALEGHLGPVTAVEFCPQQAGVVISVSEDRTFKVWDHRAGALLYSSPVLTAHPLLSVLADAGTEQLVTGSADGQLWVFSLAEGHSYRRVACVDLRRERKRFSARRMWLGPGGRPRDPAPTAPRGRPRGARCPSAAAPERGASVEATCPVLSLARCTPPAPSPSRSAGCAWVGSATALFLLNLANFELEAALPYAASRRCGGAVLSARPDPGPACLYRNEDSRDLSIRVAGSCAVVCEGSAGKAFCLLTSLFGSEVALLEIHLAVPGARPGPDAHGSLCVQASSPVPATSPLYSGAAQGGRPRLGGQKRPAARRGMRDQPLVFHSQVRSSGYTAAPPAALFTPRTNARRGGTGAPGPRGSPLRCGAAARVLWSCDRALDRGLPTRLRRQRPAVSGQVAVCCVQYSGHDGAVSALSWSRDGRWLLSTSRDRTLRLWSARRMEPALVLGEGLSPGPPAAAQFYYMDAFILLSSGPELQLLRHHADPSKDELRRYKPRSRCRRVFRLPLAAEITSLAAVNDFYSRILRWARARALEVVDLAAGRSAAVIAEAHSRPVHQICQSRGSAFTSQQAQAYNLFATAAVGDGVRLWDLRTLRCERRFEGHPCRSYPCGLAFSPCGRYVVCGAEDRHAYVYEVGSSTFSHRLAGHTDAVTGVAFSPVAPQLVTATLDGMLQLFAAEAQSLGVRTDEVRPGEPASAAFGGSRSRASGRASPPGTGPDAAVSDDLSPRGGRGAQIRAPGARATPETGSCCCRRRCVAARASPEDAGAASPGRSLGAPRLSPASPGGSAGAPADAERPPVSVRTVRRKRRCPPRPDAYSAPPPALAARGRRGPRPRRTSVSVHPSAAHPSAQPPRASAPPSACARAASASSLPRFAPSRLPRVRLPGLLETPPAAPRCRGPRAAPAALRGPAAELGAPGDGASSQKRAENSAPPPHLAPRPPVLTDRRDPGTDGNGGPLDPEDEFPEYSP